MEIAVRGDTGLSEVPLKEQQLSSLHVTAQVYEFVRGCDTETVIRYWTGSLPRVGQLPCSALPVIQEISRPITENPCPLLLRTLLLRTLLLRTLLLKTLPL